MSGNILLNFIAGDPSKGLIGAKAYSYASTRNPTLVIPEIANKNSPFFPHRDIQEIATNEDEVFEFLFQKFKLFNSSKDYYTSITEKEIFSISRENNSNRLAMFILK